MTMFFVRQILAGSGAGAILKCALYEIFCAPREDSGAVSGSFVSPLLLWPYSRFSSAAPQNLANDQENTSKTFPHRQLED